MLYDPVLLVELGDKFIVADHIRGKEDLERLHMEQLIGQQQEHIVIQDH